MLGGSARGPAASSGGASSASHTEGLGDPAEGVPFGPGEALGKARVGVPGSWTMLEAGVGVTAAGGAGGGAGGAGGAATAARGATGAARAGRPVAFLDHHPRHVVEVVVFRDWCARRAGRRLGRHGGGLRPCVLGGRGRRRLGLAGRRLGTAAAGASSASGGVSATAASTADGAASAGVAAATDGVSAWGVSD